MHLANVPFDIQLQTLQFCSPKELAILSRVHSSLRDVAEYVLYSHIFVWMWTSNLVSWKWQLEGTQKSLWALVEEKSLLHTLVSSSRKAAMVKALELKLLSTQKVDLPLLASKLAEALEAMPNLVDLRITCDSTSNPVLEKTISQVIRGGHFRLHTLYLDNPHDLEGIIADQAQLRLLGIHDIDCSNPSWAKVKGLYQSSLRRHDSPTIFLIDDWFRIGPRITMFPAFHNPAKGYQEYQNIATSPKGLNSFYREIYVLSFCLLGISEENINLLGEMMQAMAICMRIRYHSMYLPTLRIIIHDTSIHKPWRCSDFVKSLTLFDNVWDLDFYYPDFERQALIPLAMDLRMCLLNDLRRAWPRVREIKLQDGHSSISVDLDDQDINWVSGRGTEPFADSDDENWLFDDELEYLNHVDSD